MFKLRFSSQADAHILRELANRLLPFFYTGVSYGWCCFASSEDKGVLICHCNSEFIVYICHWSLALNSRSLFGVCIGKPDQRDICWFEVYVTFGFAKFVKVVVIKDTIVAEGHLALVQKDITLLAKGPSQSVQVALSTLRFRALSLGLWCKWAFGTTACLERNFCLLSVLAHLLVEVRVIFLWLAEEGWGALVGCFVNRAWGLAY